MNNKLMKVRYCYTEKELNEFLETLSIENNSKPRLQNIIYVTNPQGGGTEEEFKVSCEVIAIVQYIIEIEVKENE